MKTSVTIPKLGLTMEQATIEGWRHKVGDKVAAGEALLDIATDKVTVEMESPATGYLRAILADTGAEVPVGAEVAVITDDPEEPFEGV